LSAVKKRSVSINGHRTSYSIEDEFQAALEVIAAQQNSPLARLIANIDQVPRPDGGLSSAIRVFVLNHFNGTLKVEAVEPTQVLSAGHQG
jgi:predicted DNA-binding ribbon-helix-helix protein